MSSVKNLKFQPSYDFEQSMNQKGYKKIAGVDEAGRGPLAGPVVAAACFIPNDVYIEDLVECKQLTPLRRESLFAAITNDPQIEYGVGIVSHQEIDTINIYQATILAMNQAVKNLPNKPDFLLVDGLELKGEIPCLKIIKGDEKSFSIAAASIIAKVTRDRLMCEYHEKWPYYGFESHKGYGTKKHIEAIKEHGPCPIHRMSFAPLKTSTTPPP
jgi:ribonuclease HII